MLLYIFIYYPYLLMGINAYSSTGEDIFADQFHKLLTLGYIILFSNYINPLGPSIAPSKNLQFPMGEAKLLCVKPRACFLPH